MRQTKPFNRRKRQRTMGVVQAGRPSPRRAVMFYPQPSLRDLQYFDSSGSLGTNAASWVYQNIFSPVQGTGSSSRYGDKILAHSLQISLYVGANNPYRIVFVYDRQPNGALPSSPLPMLTVASDAFKDPDYRERFVILRDFWISNDSGSGTRSSDPRNNNFQRVLVKLRNLPSTFNGNAGTIADCQTGSYFIMIYNASTNANSMIYRTRILFRS